MAYTIFGVIALIVSVLLIGIVLIQNSKGGGLSSAFGASNLSSMIGARRSTEEVEKWTWYLAGGLLVAAFCANVSSGSDTVTDTKSRMQNQIENGGGINFVQDPSQFNTNQENSGKE